MNGTSRKTLGIAIAVIIVIAVIGVAAYYYIQPAAPGKKIAVVSDIGGRGDLSFNDMGFKGGDEAASAFGIQMVELISKSEADYVPNLETAAKDPDVILTVGIGFLLTDAITQVADRYPDKNFAIIDGFVPGKPNVMSILFEEHKGSALVGALATLIAAQFGAEHIGVVLGIEIPVLWKFEIGYKWGAQWATEWMKKNKPDKAFDYSKNFVLWTYTGTFSDITKGYTAAKEMYAQGAIATYNVAGPLGLGINRAVQEIADQRGLTSGPPYWIGVDANQDWINPGFVVASMMKRVDKGVYFGTQLVIEGKFRQVVADNGGIVTLGVGTTVGGAPIEGISVSSLADLDEFIQMGVNAEKLTGKKVLPATPDEIKSKIAAMRNALPSWIWDAVKELEQAIRSGQVTVPLAFTQEEVTKWRDILG